MKCWKTQDRDHIGGNVKVKMVNHLKSPYRKEPDFDNIVDQLCTRLQDIKDHGATEVGMHLDSLEQREAVRRYYAAFPALKKGEESPQQYYLPPPAWCRKIPDNTSKVKMQSESLSKDYNSKKKLSTGKERRNSYHGQRKGKKRSHNHSRSFDSKEHLPEWVTHEGVWDMETQDPIKEFIKAIAVDEGYGTCENTVTDDFREMAQAKLRMQAEWDEGQVKWDVGQAEWDMGQLGWDAGLDERWPGEDELKPRSPIEEELYAKFEAKFDRSIEALWARDATPDECQELPIDFHDLLASPSDQRDKCETVWSPTDQRDKCETVWSPTDKCEAVWSPCVSPAQRLTERLQPLNLNEPLDLSRPFIAAEPFSLYSCDGIYEAVAGVGDVMRSLAALNHSRGSRFAEVVPRRAPRPPAPPRPAPAPPRHDDDPLVSERTHFKPIRRSPPPAPARYADGATFDVRASLSPAPFARSPSGFLRLPGDDLRYLEYRTRSINYGRLGLTPAQREGNDLDDAACFRLKFAVTAAECAVQTDPPAESGRAKRMRGAEGGDEREWDELLSDISAATGLAGGAGGERKRRHSARRCPRACAVPHAPFLRCGDAARPLTR
ncbi:uncharacterized protein LOC119692520 isoform X1 [Plutella xylostella]|uniref:uncharacterized protein LOC119692520 isoform X1 n=2 Tax=Plutella xylostella TaxID=51655 RepID=UPI0020325DEE|nr:uncharacterized protein LOC119692520 isoform X1 [Plutella xylostella]